MKICLFSLNKNCCKILIIPYFNLWIDSITLKGIDHGYVIVYVSCVLTCLILNEMIYELVGWWCIGMKFGCYEITCEIWCENMDGCGMS